jgi:hypothetical protein
MLTLRSAYECSNLSNQCGPLWGSSTDRTQAVEARHHIYYEPTKHTAGVEQARRLRNTHQERRRVQRVLGC